MSAVSSPVAYPVSSPPVAKRKHGPQAREARKTRTVGGFLVDSDDEDGPDTLEPVPKKRLLDTPASPLSPSEQTTTTRQFGFLIDDDEIDEPTRGPVVPSPPPTQTIPSFLSSLLATRPEARTCSGKTLTIQPRQKRTPMTFEEMAAQRSTTRPGRAKKSFYGVDIQKLIEEANSAASAPTDSSVLPTTEQNTTNVHPQRTMMWTEKYRAKKFMELVGDDRVNRQVLGWLKTWDPVVFGKSSKPLRKFSGQNDEETQTRKILLLTGPPGLGKTTLAHVCARQAGYDVLEINASDERSRDVVRGRIRTSVGTETVKSVGNVIKAGHVEKAARPVCVVVDEVDGVVGGTGASGEGGFVKALLDLLVLDQKNAAGFSQHAGKKRDNFRLRRPIILVCNDLYHPSLRPLRQSHFAEIVHIRPPPLDAVVTRMRTVFDKEGVPCDNDGVRRLCECAWGMAGSTGSRRSTSSTAEGDLRGVLVVGEWVAARLRAGALSSRLTRRWVEDHLLSDLSHGGQGARSMGRGGAKEVVSRVFLHGAGFEHSLATAQPEAVQEGPRSKLHATEITKRAGMERLRDMVDASGEIDKIVTDIWSEYPLHPYNDDTTLSKPDAAYEWFSFHDTCSRKVFGHQEWEMAPYLSQSVLACHNLFAGPARRGGHTQGKRWSNEEDETEETPFSGPKAEYAAHEMLKTNQATLQELQAALSPALRRSLRDTAQVATDLVPYLVRILTPDIKPVVVRGAGEQVAVASVRRASEKKLVTRAVEVMNGVGVKFHRGRIDESLGDAPGSKVQTQVQWVYRMEPPIDFLTHFETGGAEIKAPPVRYAVRQVLDQEHTKAVKTRELAAQQARLKASDDAAEKAKQKRVGVIDTVKRDFFGRVIEEKVLQETDSNAAKPPKTNDDIKVWVTFHEGFSNAVRKPITMQEFMRGL